jgi:uncharacterized protein YbjT (DUF2867 family)
MRTATLPPTFTSLAFWISSHTQRFGIVGDVSTRERSSESSLWIFVAIIWLRDFCSKAENSSVNVTGSTDPSRSSLPGITRRSCDFERTRLMSILWAWLGLLLSEPMAFRVLIIGGTGQVGAAVVRALVAQPSCAEIVMVNRKATALTGADRMRQVILDTATAEVTPAVTTLATSMVALGDPVYGASCVGVGKGSAKWSEEELKALELGVVGGFARGCHAGGVDRFALLSAVGSTSKSRIRYERVMGLKEETVQRIGFTRLAIFRPGIIGGNVHTPGYVARLGRLIPGRFGTIEQDDIGRAFAAEFTKSTAPDGVLYLENAAMKQQSRELAES